MLTDAGNKATENGERIADGLTRLLTHIETSAGGFTGDAGSALQGVSADLGRELKGILQALNQMANEVHAANRHYGTTDADASREINSILTHDSASTPVADALR